MTLKEQIEKVLLDSIVKDGITTTEAARQVLEIVEKEVLGCVPEEDNAIRKFSWNMCRRATLSRLHSLFAGKKEV